MIIYGTKAKHLLTENVPHEKCGHCGTEGNLQMGVFQKYAHIFWIPFFPLGKTGAAQCSHCQKATQLKDMSQNLKLAYEEKKSRTRTPLYLYSGAGLLVILIVFGIFAGKQHQEKIAAYVDAPQKGDVYEVKTEGGNFTLFRIEELSGDTCHLRFHEYETTKQKGLHELHDKGEAGFSKLIIPLPTAELKQMLADEKVLDIIRK